MVEPSPGPDEEDTAAKATWGISPLFALVIILTLGVVGIGIWASTRGTDIAVWEVTSNVPAHHVLTRSDVKLAVRRTGGAFASYPIGRMTLRALSEGAPVRETDLGPDVAGRLGQDVVVVGIAASPRDAVAGSLAAGDFVGVISSATKRVAPIEGIVIATSVSRADARPTYLVAVAVRRNDAQDHNWFRGPARLTLVRELSPALPDVVILAARTAMNDLRSLLDQGSRARLAFEQLPGADHDAHEERARWRYIDGTCLPERFGVRGLVEESRSLL